MEAWNCLQGSRALSRMKLAPEMVAKLAERRVNTAQELLSLSRLDLLELLEDVCDSDIEEVVRSVSATVAGKPVTVRELEWDQYLDAKE